MTWTETSKSSSKWLKKRGTRTGKVFRDAFETYNTRGEIALAIHGDAGATVTRKYMENYFGEIKKENNFTETDKDISNFAEVSKGSSSFTEKSKGSSDWSEN